MSPRPDVVLAQPAAHHWDFPRSVAGVAVLVEHGRCRGVDAAGLLRGTGLAVADLATPDREVTAEQELRVVRNLQQALGAHGAESAAQLGSAVGRDYHVSAFGILGFALLASRTVLDAVDLALRFLDLSFIFARPTVGIAGEQVRVGLAGDDLPPDVRAFLVARDAAAIATVLGELVPGGVGATISAERDGMVVSFAAKQLERPLPQANPQTVALCEQLCRDVVERRRRRTGTASRVRVLIAQRLAQGAPMAEVAADLHLAPRTLRRRLEAEGTSYRSLLDEVRSSLAAELLGTGLLSVEDVALRLGYAEASSFIVAHRRWTGRTPAAVRPVR